MQIEPNEIKPGSIIKRRISGIFWHMGIYIGNNQVIHFHNPELGHGVDKGIFGKNGATIRMESLDKFAEKGQVFIHAEPKNKKHAQKVIERAKNFYKNPDEYNGKYNLLTKNCEHFATTCFGRDLSPMMQTTKVITKVISISAVFIITAVVGNKIGRKNHT